MPLEDWQILQNVPGTSGNVSMVVKTLNLCVCLVSLTEAYFELSSFDQALCLSANIRRLKLLNQFMTAAQTFTHYSLEILHSHS